MNKEKKEKNTKKNTIKKRWKKGKETPKEYAPRRAQKMIFFIRTVKWNRNEIEVPKKIRF